MSRNVHSMLLAIGLICFCCQQRQWLLVEPMMLWCLHIQRWKISCCDGDFELQFRSERYMRASSRQQQPYWLQHHKVVLSSRFQELCLAPIDVVDVGLVVCSGKMFTCLRVSGGPAAFLLSVSLGTRSAPSIIISELHACLSMILRHHSPFT